MDFDDILPHIGEFGSYQKTIYLLLCLPASISSALTLFSSIFISATPDHWCRVPELDCFADVFTPAAVKELSIPITGTGKFHKCEMYDVNYTAVITRAQLYAVQPVSDESWPRKPCDNGWHYDTTFYTSTLVTQTDAVCEAAWKVSMAQSVFYVGNVVGSLFFGYIGDRFGRKPSLTAVILLNVVTGLLTSFTSSYEWYIAYRGIIGLTFPAIFQTPVIMGMELMSPDKRTFSGMLVCIFFAIAMMALAGLASLLRDWFSLSLVCSVPFIALLALWWAVPESPRWLLSHNRLLEAEVLVQKIAKKNGRKISRNFLQTWFEEKSHLKGATAKLDEALSVTALIRYPNIIKKVLIVSFCWTANTMVYNGLSFGVSSALNISEYLSFCISGAAEIPGIILAWVTMDRIGRRPVMIATMLLGGVACTSTFFLPSDAVWVAVSLSSIGKMAITASFAIIYIYGAELFPTVLRAFAMGFPSMFAGLSLVLTPQILFLGQAHGTQVPNLIFGALAIAGGFSVFFLPETSKAHLPQTLQEGEAFGKDSSFWSCSGNRNPATLEKERVTVT
ncbi:beta-alanine transporter-like [Ornithodoros turicata]|uniref:beta-alanine transporter-like n=1 Tax=Ornithodoros turicata TaxID=34597 RepID=UPI00313A3B95